MFLLQMNSNILKLNKKTLLTLHCSSIPFYKIYMAHLMNYRWFLDLKDHWKEIHQINFLCTSLILFWIWYKCLSKYIFVLFRNVFTRIWTSSKFLIFKIELYDFTTPMSFSSNICRSPTNWNWIFESARFKQRLIHKNI